MSHSAPTRGRITAVVLNRLHPERFKQHGVIQNGILLYGPRGTGKTFLAEATAGEFHINYWYVKPTSMLETRVGNSEANIREAFARAYAHRPVLFFMDDASVQYLDNSAGWELGTGPSLVVLDAGFGKTLSTTTLQKGVYAFIFDQKGLMGGVGIQGSKITRINPNP